ncbi:MAG: DUF434 domain-containing protein [Campylobacterales bacterium]|nr:DUF434 domain-containing protein [Campylobacterales bacterium]
MYYNYHMRKYHGLPPEDTLFFNPKRLAVLRQAVGDLSWLLQCGYSTKAALTLVGNHFQLVERERLAIVHTAGDGAVRNTPLVFGALRGKTLCIDGSTCLSPSKRRWAAALSLSGRMSATATSPISTALMPCGPRLKRLLPWPQKRSKRPGSPERSGSSTAPFPTAGGWPPSSTAPRAVSPSRWRQ